MQHVHIAATNLKLKNIFSFAPAVAGHRRKLHMAMNCMFIKSSWKSQHMKKLSDKATGTLRAHDFSLSLLKANDYVAELIRSKMKSKGILLINLVSSPGSGKTSLLEETIRRLKDKITIAVLEGD